MKSILRTDGKKKINLADFYSNIREGKECPEFYRKTNLSIADNEYLVLETLGQGGMGFVFLAYHQRKLTALKMSYENQGKKDIFSTVKKTIGDGYRNYFLSPKGETVKIDSFYLGELKPENEHFFDKDIYVSSWEPADATLSDKLDENFETKLKWFRRFMEGLNIIHSRERAHFDIKLDNLFLVGNQLKIGDFEFYFKIEDFIQSDIYVCGTPGHIAPEMFYHRNHITPKIDIFSAGIAFAQLFTGQVPAGHPLNIKKYEEEIKKLFNGHEDQRFLEDDDFLENCRIYLFFKDLVRERLEVSQLSPEEKTLYNLLLRMIAIEPKERPGADELLINLNPISEGPEEGPKTTEAIERSGDPFARLLQTHERREVIKYCLLPDLLDRLENVRMKEKIIGVGFEGNDYNKRYFSFAALDGEAKLQLFGKEISSRQVKNNKDWNLFVLVDYWNRMFHLGLEKAQDEKYILAVLEGINLTPEDKDIFRGKIKTARKFLQRARKKIHKEVYT